MVRRASFSLAFVLLAISFAAVTHAAMGSTKTQKADQRLRTRLLRWEEMCRVRSERKEARLRVRGMEMQHFASDVDRICSAITERLRMLGIATGSNSSSTTSSTSSSSSPSSPASPSASSSEHLLPNQLFIPVPPLPVIAPRSQYLILGQTGPVIGSIKMSPQDEPVEVREIEITLDSAVSSLSSIEVFDEFGFVLGNAIVDRVAGPGGNVYTLSLSPDQAYFIARHDDVVVAFRSRMKGGDSGGSAGQSLQISTIDITAIGQWSSRDNLVETSGSDFQTHETALIGIEKIERVGNELGTFSTGNGKMVGSFRFTATSTKDADADPAITEITFSISHPSEVTVTNPVLRDPSAGTETNCSIASSTIVCSSIPSDVGAFEEARTLSVYADVALSGSSGNPFLQIEMNQGGGPNSAGDITWTDGEASFDWVPFSSPVAQGTSWR
ncbi:MAG TPA: hypothetical protein VJB82_03140 [Candidatus Peribacterales bacterium]|nr:hypothetical protein [Candidatus Peribacterales bacterium]